MIIVELHCPEKFLTGKAVEISSEVIEKAKNLSKKIMCPYVVVDTENLKSVNNVFGVLVYEYRKINEITTLTPVKVPKGSLANPSLHSIKSYL